MSGGLYQTFEWCVMAWRHACLSDTLLAHTFSYYVFFSFFYVLFQISLDPPIKQGQTRYHFLILLFSKDEDVNLTLSMSEWVALPSFQIFF